MQCYINILSLWILLLSELKQALYRVATTWMITLGANSAMATVAGDFIPHVLTDAKPHHDSVKVSNDMPHDDFIELNILSPLIILLY